jgi:parvulin-like peptidyl-prolyl isomerase
LQSILEWLKKEESFANLAKQLPTDKGSRKKGGDLDFLEEA